VKTGLPEEEIVTEIWNGVLLIGGIVRQETRVMMSEGLANKV
jgi:hypothetical protein